MQRILRVRTMITIGTKNSNMCFKEARDMTFYAQQVERDITCENEIYSFSEA